MPGESDLGMDGYIDGAPAAAGSVVWPVNRVAGEGGGAARLDDIVALGIFERIRIYVKSQFPARCTEKKSRGKPTFWTFDIDSKIRTTEGTANGIPMDRISGRP